MTEQPAIETSWPAPGTLLPARSDAMLPEGARMPELVQKSVVDNISPRTGEARRPWTVAAAVVCGDGTLLACVVFYAVFWMQSLTDVFHAARVVEWLRPTVSSPQAVFAPLLILAILAAVVIPVTVSGHFGWNGSRRARWTATLGAVLSVAFPFVLTTLAAIAIAPAVATAVLLWLPQSRRFAQAQSALRAARS